MFFSIAFEVGHQLVPWGTVMMIMIVAEGISLEEKEVNTGELENLEGEKKEAILGEKSGMIGWFDNCSVIFKLFSLMQFYKVEVSWNQEEVNLGLREGPVLNHVTNIVNLTEVVKDTAQRVGMMHPKLQKG